MSAPPPRPTRITGSTRGRGQPRPVGIIHPDDRPVGQPRREERRLGLEVGLHVGVEVQVVLGQVGEGRHREAAPRHPAQGQGVGGDLHGRHLDPGADHAGEQPLEVRRLRAWCAPPAPPRRRSEPRRCPPLPEPGRRRPRSTPPDGKSWSSRWSRSPRPVAGAARGRRAPSRPGGPWPPGCRARSGPGLRPAGSSSTHTAAAPAARAWLTKRCPSTVNPRTAMNSTPGPAARESWVTSEISDGRIALQPPSRQGGQLSQGGRLRGHRGALPTGAGPPAPQRRRSGPPPSPRWHLPEERRAPPPPPPGGRRWAPCR